MSTPSSNATPAVEVDGLHKSFGDVDAVNAMSFTVEPGDVFCLVGPNGAGKTTTVECIIGLQTPDAGTIRVLGQNPQTARTTLFESVGVQFQENSLYGNIKVREAIYTFARLYETPRNPEALLDAFDIAHCRDTYYKHLSGGERRKLLIATALVGDPDLVVLDEPTSGLDPHARRALWRTLHRFREETGLTVLLTTHDMREAEQESDVVCVMDEGRRIAIGAPEALVDAHQLGTHVAARLHNGDPVRTEAFDALPGLTRLDVIDRTLHLYGTGDEFTPAVTQLLEEKGLPDYSLRPAGLEDLYLIVTGNRYTEGD